MTVQRPGLKGTKAALTLAAVACVLWLRPSAAQQANVTELEGTWEAVRSTVGETARTFKPGEMRLVFVGKTLTATGLVSYGAEAKVVEFRLDATKQPKEFDYTRAPGEVNRSIYELRGNTLTIVVPRSPSDPRPAKMDVASRDVIVLVLERRQ